MPTEYNDIAEQYRSSKQVPWRFHIEQYSLFDVLGDVQGLDVLDLACGEGHYTRLHKALAAGRVVGVDLSSRMIELARQTEQEQPLGVEYQCADARDVNFARRFDVVTAAYLLNYARSKDELLAMCQAVSRCLKPGGRFVTVNNNPAQSIAAFESTRKYGFIKIANTGTGMPDGTPLRYRLFLDNDAFEIENYHLSVATHEAAFAEAGLSGVRWHSMKLSPQEAAGPNRGYWEDFFVEPPVVLIEARAEP